MAIEFDKSRPTLPTAASTAKPGAPGSEPKPGSQATTEGGVAAGDAVTLTGVSSRIRDLIAEAGREVPLDQHRIAELRAAIADGRYEVDSTRLAHKLMQTERELFP